MPRLLLFAPCQRAIIDRDDGSVSLVPILGGITYQPADEQELETLPDDATAVIPFDWATIAIWLRLPEDENRTFQQRVQVLLPDGDALGDAVSTFSMKVRTHQEKVAGNVFPVRQSGEYVFRLFLREATEGSEWVPMHDYPIEVTKLGQKETD